MGNAVKNGLESRFERYGTVMIKAPAQKLSAKSYRTVTWREGTNTRLGSHFARVRCSVAQYNRRGKEQWLIIEGPEVEAKPIPPHPILSVQSACRHRVQNLGAHAHDALAH